MKMDKPKVMVIGLDGATFYNLKPWMDEGLLPNLKFLVDNGVSGELESTIPSHSAPAWTSFMTGVNPGKHGVFGFFRPFHDERFKRELTTSKDIKSKTIFEILSEYEKTSITVNLPITYPPFKINGFMVSCGLTTPSIDFDFTYPKDLFDRIGVKRTDYSLDIHPNNYPDNEKSKFFSDLIKDSNIKKEIGFKLLNSCDWDLFVLVFAGPDRLHHYYWHCIDPEHPRYNPDEARIFLPLIKKYYQNLDSLVAEFISYADNNTSLFLVSDHGFTTCEKKIAINNVFNQNGLLYYKTLNFIEKLNMIQHKIRSFLQHNSFIYRKIKTIIKSGHCKLKRTTTQKIASEQRLKKQLGTTTSKYWQEIDWKRTLAHSGFADNSICLNLKGREQEGIINTDNGDYLKIQKQIIDITSNIFDPLKQRKLKVKVHKKEEIYTGPYVQDAPELFFEIEDGQYMLHGAKKNKSIIEDTVAWMGRHKKNGILICYGKNFKRGHNISNARIIDIVPTILYNLKMQSPEYVDGRLLTEIFDPNFTVEHQINRKNINHERKVVTTEVADCSSDEIEEVRKKLSELGYL